MKGAQRELRGGLRGVDYVITGTVGYRGDAEGYIRCVESMEQDRIGYKAVQRGTGID